MLLGQSVHLGDFGESVRRRRSNVRSVWHVWRFVRPERLPLRNRRCVFDRPAMSERKLRVRRDELLHRLLLRKYVSARKHIERVRPTRRHLPKLRHTSVHERNVCGLHSGELSKRLLSERSLSARNRRERVWNVSCRVLDVQRDDCERLHFRPMPLWNRARVLCRPTMHGRKLCLRRDLVCERLLFGNDVHLGHVSHAVWNQRSGVLQLWKHCRSMHEWRLCMWQRPSVWLRSTLRFWLVRLRLDVVRLRLLQRQFVRDESFCNAMWSERFSVHVVRFERRSMHQRSVSLRLRSGVWRGPDLSGRNVRVQPELVPVGLLQWQHVCHQHQRVAVRKFWSVVFQLRLDRRSLPRRNLQLRRRSRVWRRSTLPRRRLRVRRVELCVRVLQRQLLRWRHDSDRLRLGRNGVSELRRDDLRLAVV